MKVSEAIRKKRAIRSYRKERLGEKEVRAILHAGRLAQSSRNRQAWQFVAVQDRERLKKLSKMGQYAGHLAGAALGVLILTPPPEKFYGALFDAGQVAAYMQLAALEMGVVSCLAALYQGDQVRALLGIPEAWQPLIAIAFGYEGRKNPLAFRLIRGGRKGFDKVVHWEEW